MTQWKDIVGFEGYYQVSTNGNVKSLNRVIEHSNGYSRLIKGKEIKPFINGSGYLQIKLSKNGESFFPYVHKLVATAFIDNTNNYTEVNHIDHNKLNCNIANLEWCTRSENMIKMAEFYGLRNPTKCESCNKEISNGATKCKDCKSFSRRKVERPSKDELSELIGKLPLTKIGKMFGVSDNSVRKWCKSYGIL